VTDAERRAERQEVIAFLAQSGGEVLLRHLRRRWRDGNPGETGEQMIFRLGRLDALSDIERLREEAKGA
jgi:transposase